MLEWLAGPTGQLLTSLLVEKGVPFVTELFTDERPERGRGGFTLPTINLNFMTCKTRSRKSRRKDRKRGRA